jgi:hypothetical protein
LNLQAAKHEIEEKRFEHCYKITVNHRIIITSISSSAETEHTTTLIESEEEETLDKDQKFLAFVAPHEESKGSHSYYSESSDEDGEELKDAYKILYVKFLELRETRQQYVHELNSLKTERSTMLIKIQDLEEK